MAHVSTPTAALSICPIAIGRTRLTARRISLADLAEVLSSLVGCRVVDQTGLEGAYDCELEWADEGESILAAVEDQLGLQALPGPSSIALVCAPHARGCGNARSPVCFGLGVSARLSVR